MVGKELVPGKAATLDLREVSARRTLHDVRQKGHTYVELRQVGKHSIFFCTLCLTECYNERVLSDHLKGSLHARRYAGAKITLFAPNPWPFSDGVLFFTNLYADDPFLSVLFSQKSLIAGEHSSGDKNELNSRFADSSTVNLSSADTGCDLNRNAGDPSIGVDVDGQRSSSRGSGLDLARNGLEKTSNHNETDSCLTIPGVLLKEEVSNLNVRLLGIGHIACRILETNEVCGKVTRMWCAWLGQGEVDGSNKWKSSPNCEFAIVNFSYTYGLGRNWPSDDQDPPASPGSVLEIDDTGRQRKKRKKSCLNQEKTTEDPTIHCGSSVQDCPGMDDSAADAPEKLQTRLISSKTARQELRKQKRLASERACDICRQPMLPGKDVATLLNCKTGKLACSSRNTNGAFHLFHISCLIHWVLLCEMEILSNQSNNSKATRGRKGKATQKDRFSSVFCPDCHGTGICIKGEELEKPDLSLSEMFHYKLKALEGHKAWMKNPEILQTCSTGLHFPSESVDNSQEKVMPLKLLHFYRADAQ
ncbi:uncharacterized protein LOC103719200 [Phoenix dactylifera]|uniref:Uncharacterized protein LOC103719200 n=1 Tax=Phoenix dactylifera TaxID=42345 RepID=A0A8B7CU96_PHODC|nr:uncharacterized protein LOC103719200 [Phoenix dactylifera]